MRFGFTEILVLLGILVLLFGSSKIPELGAGIGQSIRNFKKSLREPDEKDITPENQEPGKKSEDRKRSSDGSNQRQS